MLQVWYVWESILHIKTKSNVLYHVYISIYFIKDFYDLIFIDAAKSQYIKFFQKFKTNLKENGVIFSDNLDFHGLTHTKEVIKRINELR